MSLAPEAMVAGLPPLPNSVELFLSIRPERISWLRFLLEGYDGLAVLSTVSATSGLVRLWLLESSLVEVMRLLAAIAPDLVHQN